MGDVELCTSKSLVVGCTALQCWCFRLGEPLDLLGEDLLIMTDCDFGVLIWRVEFLGTLPLRHTLGEFFDKEVLERDIS